MIRNPVHTVPPPADGALPESPVSLLKLLRHSALRLLLLASFFALFHTAPVEASVRDIHTSRTLDLLKQIEGVSDKQIEEYTPLIGELPYTRIRLFRIFCMLPTTRAEEIPQLLELSKKTSVRFGYIPLLEQYANLPDGSLAGFMHLLARLEQGSLVSEQVLSSLEKLPAANSGDVIILVTLVQGLSDTGQWAAQALLAVDGLSTNIVIKGLLLLDELSPDQSRGIEQLLAQNDLGHQSVLTCLERFRTLSDTDALTIGALAGQSGYHGEDTTGWLDSYFSLDVNERDMLFPTLSDKDRKLLLQAFADSADTLIWRINNLHDVTDNLGREIGSSRLAGFSMTTISELYSRLHPSARKLYTNSFNQAVQAADKGAAIATLRKATARARKLEAADLTSAQIYTLMANGSELYDSSFRDILTPLLATRIDTLHGMDLLDFLVSIDTDSLFVSNFITSLALKGKLTRFFPQESSKQKQILKLVAASALLDVDRLILFSATFTPLLKNLSPPARSYLIELLVRRISSADTVFTRQLQIILQYYRSEHPDLLLAADLQLIDTTIEQRGEIDLSPYIRTPFTEWSKDGQLTGLSVFQDDDDGRSSYHSYSRTLIRNGYTASVSALYSYGNPSPKVLAETQAAIGTITTGPSAAIRTFFKNSDRHGVAIEWKKTINSLTVVQVVYVYQNKLDQKRLWTIFLNAGHEMFAQRGHSYWRREQLFEPLEELEQEKRITPETYTAKQRFISLGSCGGIRAYTRITRLFRNRVDLLATVGTGKAAINNPYNQRFLEFIAAEDDLETWREVEKLFSRIFAENLGADYIQPGSLPAILHKMMNEQETTDATY